MTAAKIARALDGRRCGQWWSSWCPAHDDRSPSLSLSDGERGLILKCWAGCDSREVLAELRRMQLLAGCNEDARPAPAQIRSADRAYAARRMALAFRIWDAGGAREPSDALSRQPRHHNNTHAAVTALGACLPPSQRHRTAGNDRPRRQYR